MDYALSLSQSQQRMPVLQTQGRFSAFAYWDINSQYLNYPCNYLTQSVGCDVVVVAVPSNLALRAPYHVASLSPQSPQTFSLGTNPQSAQAISHHPYWLAKRVQLMVLNSLVTERSTNLIHFLNFLDLMIANLSNYQFLTELAVSDQGCHQYLLQLIKPPSHAS